MPFDTSVLQKVPFEPKHEASSDAARALIPKFLYQDPNDASLPEIKERMCGERRRLRIVVVGAGLTGLAFLHYLFDAIPEGSVDLALYERNEDVGGVVSMPLVAQACASLLIPFAVVDNALSWCTK